MEDLSSAGVAAVFRPEWMDALAGKSHLGAAGENFFCCCCCLYEKRVGIERRCDGVHEGVLTNRRREMVHAGAAFAQGGPRPSDDVVNGVLQDIAKSGLVGYSWTALSVLLADQVSRVCDDFRTQKKAGSQSSDATLFVQRLKSFARYDAFDSSSVRALPGSK